jgi:hypothetical protein
MLLKEKKRQDRVTEIPTSDQPPVFQAGQGSTLHAILSTGLSALLHSVPSFPSSEGHATIRRM